jgi:transposase
MQFEKPKYRACFRWQLAKSYNVSERTLYNWAMRCKKAGLGFDWYFNRGKLSPHEVKLFIEHHGEPQNLKYITN